MTKEPSGPPPSPYVAGPLGRCPRCGAGKLFAGVLSLAPRCSVCELDYSFADAGDGPAVFVILIAGAVVCAEALWFDAGLGLPLWVTLASCAATILGLSLLLLRAFKGLLVALQFVNKAEEARWIGAEDDRRWRK
jgi:uncharacterized protein (DUF983 family)